jgi:DNA-directed RNA polymerase subunit RPC12/RpoP
MTSERIEDFREIVLPFLSRTLLETNYENMGKSDAEEFTRDFNEILNLAIKALEQVPTTKNDLGVDCISRADAIKAMQDKAKKLKNEDTINGLCGAVAILFDMPSVTPQEPKVGQWKHDRANVRCSNCGRGYKEAFGRTSAITYNFCPNCGSKMIESKESDVKE